ncbi:MAG: hypothetical protein FWG36_08285 [Oscillospiraceae bacterium]|nr:hypothetical protein [Oscillospiraceae bacterium]
MKRRGTFINMILGIAGLMSANLFGLGLGLTGVNIIVTLVLGIPGLALLMGVRWLL